MGAGSYLLSDSLAKAADAARRYSSPSSTRLISTITVPAMTQSARAHHDDRTYIVQGRCNLGMRGPVHAT